MHQHNETGTSWSVVQAAVIGRSHIQEGTVCQDKTYTLTNGRVTAFALADGAGSARLSHFGAQTATESICRLLCENFEVFWNEPAANEVKQKILAHLTDDLAHCAAEHGCTLRDLSSTLLAVAVCESKYLLLHIGDGVIGYVKDQQIRVATTPHNGEFANQTTFITSPNALSAMRLSKGSDQLIEGFVLMSDGSSASLYSKSRKTLVPVLQRLVYRLGITSEEFLEPVIVDSLKSVISQRTLDDCSLVLAARVTRSYRDLDEKELADYFDLDAETIKPKHLSRSIRLYVEILDHLDEGKTAAELCGLCGFKQWRYFQQKWLKPLLELGYIKKTDDGIYRKLVGAFTPAPQSIESDNREVSK